MGTSIGRSQKGDDRTLGYHNGEDCPRRCGGIVTIREAKAGELVGGKIRATLPTKYAQCSRCS
jgi:hypothetical protein